MALQTAIAGQHFPAVLIGAETGLVGTLTVELVDENLNVITAPTTSGITESSEGVYIVPVVAPLTTGGYRIRWNTGTETFDQDLVVVVDEQPDDVGDEPAPVSPSAGPDLRDLRVLVPGARRATEGPWGAPMGKSALSDDQLYDMVADACAQVILDSGTLFGHELIVSERDPTVGFPTRWRTESVLNEWESKIIAIQTALNYYFFLFRDMKTSETIKNEGTEWSYTLSANVIKGYLEGLREERDKAITGLQLHSPIMTRYISNIRVRDQLTVSVLEWWDTQSPGLNGGGLGGGQDAGVVPFINGIGP